MDDNDDDDDDDEMMMIMRGRWMMMMMMEDDDVSARVMVEKRITPTLDTPGNVFFQNDEFIWNVVPVGKQ